MKKEKCFENFPLWIPLISNLFSLIIYLIGVFIFYQLGIIPAVLFVLYCIFMEINLLRNSCRHCYYYNRICGFGKGKVCALFFKKGKSSRFAEKEFSWKNLIPDMLVLFFPVIAGVISLIINFQWLILILLIILVLLSMGGNAVIRGQLTCQYCKQRKAGCPAEKLFNKK